MIRCGDKTFDLTRECLVMGVLNVTPDSFSDGGKFDSPMSAVSRALEMIEDGADIIDIGGESTNPFVSRPVEPKDELDRVLPVVRELVKKGFRQLSIDTRHADTARACLAEGASWINDVSGFTFDPKMIKEASVADGVVLMHSRGTPQDMQTGVIEYHDVVADIKEYLVSRVEFCTTYGIEKSKIIVDPGIGFGKRLEHNVALLKGLSSFQGIGAGVLSGPSRKSFLGEITGIKDPVERDYATLGAVAHSFMKGAGVIRVHNVKATREILKVLVALTN